MYIEEEQTTQWPKEKGEKDKQLSTTHTLISFKKKPKVCRLRQLSINHIHCGHCRMSDERQQHLHSRLKQGAMYN